MKNIFLAIFTLAMVACNAAPIRPVSSPIPTNVDTKKIQSAITQGAADRGWVAKQMGADTMELSLLTRGHQVTVDVKFDKTAYNITYKNSSNMDYNAEKQTIHKKYGKWINALKHSIDKYMVR